jgi:L-ascorbate metabolism protein UlaG (beta-lactamase superfamily)
VIYIDAFFQGISFVGSLQWAKPASVKTADLIMITHAHPDHFDPAQIVDVAGRTGAKVVGPFAAIDRIRRRLPAGSPEVMEPAETRAGPAAFVSQKFGAVSITAFRTCHSKGHNSYLIETPEYRVFHDGDNEDTRRLDVKSIGRLDALFLCPWQGSGCSDFIEALNPRHWFLIHMTDGELVEHKAGTFLPPLCGKIPPGVIALHPGQSFTADD